MRFKNKLKKNKNLDNLFHQSISKNQTQLYLITWTKYN